MSRKPDCLPCGCSRFAGSEEQPSVGRDLPVPGRNAPGSSRQKARRSAAPPQTRSTSDGPKLERCWLYKPECCSSRQCSPNIRIFDFKNIVNFHSLCACRTALPPLGPLLPARFHRRLSHENGTPPAPSLRLLKFSELSVEN